MATKNATKKESDAKQKKEPKTSLSEDQLKEMYEQMVLIRRFEEKTGQVYQMKKFTGFCHLYIGQEAVGVGSAAAIEMGRDYIFQTYRDHGHALLWGIPPKEVMSELFMRYAGSSRGKGGSMHFYNGKQRYMGGNGIVGGHTPLATGAAFASKYRKEGAVTLCYLGDAAINQGTFHESLNMAGLWKLPIVYIVENNIYGMGTAVNRASAEPELYKRTECAYKIPGKRVNGMDVLEVHEMVKEAVDKARKDSQPTFLEMVCYRYRGHSMSDPATTYRTKDEVSEWQTKDPIDRLRGQFPDLITDDWAKEVDENAKKTVQEAIDFAEEQDFPDQSKIWTDVYVNCQGYPTEEESDNPYAFPYEEYETANRKD